MTVTIRRSDDHIHRQTLTPYLYPRGAADAMAFYEAVLGAEVIGDVWRDPDDGRVGSAMPNCASGTWSSTSPTSTSRWESCRPAPGGGTTVSLVLLVDDLDPVWGKGSNGATVERDITLDHGRRAGWLTDPRAHRWKWRVAGVGG